MSGTKAHPGRGGGGHPDRLQGTQRRMAGLVLAVAGGSLVGAGALASWDASASALSGGPEVTAALQDVGDTPLTDAVAGLLPGDRLFRYLDVTNGSGRVATFTGTVTVTGDLAGHLTVDAVACTVPWTTADAASTCAGDVTELGAGTPTPTAPLVLRHGTIAAGAAAAQHVRYTLTLTVGTSAAAQGATGGLDIAVSNTAVGGTGS